MKNISKSKGQKGVSNIILGLVSVFVCMPTFAQQKTEGRHHDNMQSEHNKNMQHGSIVKGAEKFPSIAYDETIKIRPIEKQSPPKIVGDPKKGRLLAYTNKARCLACHILDSNSVQPGNLGPNLSTYGNLRREDSYTFQQIWDARFHNIKTLMPPFGTNELLTQEEVMHIVMFLNTLKNHVPMPKRPKPVLQNFNIAGKDFTFADVYIENGEELFRKPGENGNSCASCHSSPYRQGIKLKGIASSYPKYEKSTGKIMGLEERNNLCLSNNMSTKPYRLGSLESNLLSSYVKYLDRNTPIRVATDNITAKAMERGKLLFKQKAGQLNFSCADCHTTAPGKWLRGQALSSIRPNDRLNSTAASWPRHFIARHDLGLISLRQRIRHCQIVTRTKPLPLSAPEYVDLELYLTTLANGKPLVAPTMSKFSDE